MSLRIQRFLAAVALVTLSLVPAAQAQVVFEDDFNSAAVDGSKWAADPGWGSIVQSEGTLKLYGPGCGYFPLLLSSGTTFPAGAQPFRFTLRHRYLGVGPSGNGMNWLNASGGLAAEMWQDSFHAQYFSVNTEAGWQGFFYTGAVDTQWHDLVAEYCGGFLTVWLDGVQRLHVHSCNVPTQLRLGHPAGTSACDWSSQEYDYVRIERMNSCGTPNLDCTTPTLPSTWGRVKTLYR